MGLSGTNSERELLNMLRAKSGIALPAAENTLKAASSKKPILAQVKEEVDEQDDQKPVLAEKSKNSVNGEATGEGEKEKDVNAEK